MNHLEIGELGAAIVLVTYAVHKLRRRYFSKPVGVTRHCGKSPALSAPYGGSQIVVLKPHTLKWINEARKRFSAPMLSEIGFRNVIATIADVRIEFRPRSLVDLLTYVILFEVADTRYYQSSDAGNTKFSIYVKPGEYNLGMGAVASDVGRASHWGCRSATPARALAREIAWSSDFDPYAEFAAAVTR